MGIVETALLANIIFPWSFFEISTKEEVLNDQVESEEIVITELYY